jgi:hypothetical protein
MSFIGFMHTNTTHKPKISLVFFPIPPPSPSGESIAIREPIIDMHMTDKIYPFIISSPSVF